mgnify:CR=1 FL=1
MPTIEFRTYHEKSYQLFRPVAAKEFMPEWWKKMKIRVDHRGRLTQTIRSCPSMQDWLTMGYYIVATEDIPVRNGSTWDWPDESEEFGTPEWFEQHSASHPKAQLADYISYMGDDAPVHDAFKVSSYWNMKTPPGYSVLFLDPFLFQNRFFACWQGVIDTDKFNVNLDNAQIIFYPKVKHSFWIEAGTPLVQVFPFKRDEWTSTYFLQDADDWYNKYGIDEDSMQKWQRKMKLVDEETGLPTQKLNIGGYRSAKIWQPKSRMYNKVEEGENPPPECPMHKPEQSEEVQLEMDFNDVQRSHTDLNWDGSISKKIDRE